MKENEILVIYGTKYKEITKRILEESELLKRISNKGCRIGIKPNLVSPTEASYGATTHPEIIAGIIEYLQENGCTNLVILEGSWVGDKTVEAFRVCGYEELSKRYQVELVDTQRDTHQCYDCKGVPIHICDSAKEIDFMINVPVLKGHCQTKITCALKNMKGLIPNSEKRHFHTMGLHRPIAHLNTELHQDFIVVDNICGDLDFEDGGNPVVTNRIMTAVDPVLCDAYVCELLHYSVDEVPYISMAERLGVGCADVSRLKLCECNQAAKEVLIPSVRKIVELKDAVEEVDSCSACYGYLIPALDRLKEEGVLSGLDTKISIGQGFKKREGKLGIGNCTKNFTTHLPGCPPTENQIYEFLKAYIQG